MSELPPTGNTTQTRPENRAFFPALDGLRAVAFLMVFGQHYLSLAWGWTGVNVFFVLSGFLITGILFDTRDQEHRAWNFYVRRTLRIFPLYYGLFLVLLLLWPVLHWRWDRWWLMWPLYLGNFLRYLSPQTLVWHTPMELAADAHLTSLTLPRTEIFLGHLWSLCVEEQFYLVWPWVVFSVRQRRKLLWICSAAVLLGPVLRLKLASYAPAWMVAGELLYRFTPAQADALLLGGLVALLWRGPERKDLLVAARLAALAGTLLLGWYMVFVIRDWRIYPGRYPGWMFTGGLEFADVYAAALMVCALEPGGWVFTILRQRMLRWVGRLSYGAYIFHDLLHGLYVHLVVRWGGARFAWDTTEREFVVALLALPCTLLLAALSFRYFETPFLDMKERWTRHGSVRADAA